MGRPVTSANVYLGRSPFGPATLACAVKLQTLPAAFSDQISELLRSKRETKSRTAAAEPLGSPKQIRRTREVIRDQRKRGGRVVLHAAAIRNSRGSLSLLSEMLLQLRRKDMSMRQRFLFSKCGPKGNHLDCQ
jgi:hypothetical protein